MKTLQQSIYDFPKYYDLVYGSDWRAECIFLKRCFEKYADGIVHELFEPACGTGRLLNRFGKKGYSVAGIDLNQKAVDFCNRRLAKRKIEGRAFVGDMTDFEVDHPYDAAFNTINSFRHLTTHDGSVGHLNAMAGAIRSGGIYVLGLHLTPTAIAPSEDESWVANSQDLQVNTRMWLTDRNLEHRHEKFNIEFEVYTPARFFRIRDELIFRTYTAPQFDELIREASLWDVVGIHDFAYQIDSPVQVTDRSEDIVYVLRRK